MTEKKWLTTTTRLAHMLLVRQVAMDARRLRLFGVACCRRVPQWTDDERLAAGLTAAEAFADGRLTAAELESARQPIEERYRAFLADRPRGRILKRLRVELLALGSCLHTMYPEQPYHAAQAANSCLDWRDLLGDEVLAELRELFPRLLRDIYGNPFRPVAFSPSWRTDTAVTLARQMYESRDFSAMPILADALQDAGCDSAEILTHCRETGEGSLPRRRRGASPSVQKQTHVRGCWVVDLVLGKE
jgi:hypothetical protein